MFIKITDEISIGGQPEEKDIGKFAEFGFKSVINLRDPSEDNSLNKQSVEEVLTHSGIKYSNIPVTMLNLDEDLVREVSNKIAEYCNNQSPLLIHCGTGKRAGAMTLLHLAVENGWTLDESFEKAKELGFDCESEPEMKSFFENYILKHSRGEG